MSAHDRGGPTRPMGDEPSDAIRAGHEVEEVRTRPIVLFGIGLAANAIIVFVLMALLFRTFEKEIEKDQKPMTPLVAGNRGRLPPEPRLQISPLQDWRTFAAAQESLLTTYGWADRDSGRVRIPIEQAMRLVAERAGFPPPAQTIEIDHRVPKPPDSTVNPAPSDRSGRLPRGDLRLRPPEHDVVPVPADSVHRREGER